METSEKAERMERIKNMLPRLRNLQISAQEIYQRSNLFLRKLLILSIEKEKDGFLLATISKAICATEDIDHSKLRGYLEIRSGQTSNQGEDKWTFNYLWTINKHGISIRETEVYDRPHFPLERLEKSVYPDMDEWSASDFCAVEFDDWEENFLKNIDGLSIINDTLTGIKKVVPEG